MDISIDDIIAAGKNVLGIGENAANEATSVLPVVAGAVANVEAEAKAEIPQIINAVSDIEKTVLSELNKIETAFAHSAVNSVVPSPDAASGQAGV
jgi:hypothetical protein